MKAKVEQALRDSLGDTCDFDPSRTISMPIRASDKCVGEMHREGQGQMDGESECFSSLERYMEMAEQIRKVDPQVNTIILTSEDERYLEYRHQYTQDGRWRFIVNRADVGAGTGSIDVLEKTYSSMDEHFVSFFSTIQLQLKGKYFILNCSSNFHQLIRKLAKYGGCTPTTNAVIYCLEEQYAENHLCTNKDALPQCTKQRNKEMAAKKELAERKARGPSPYRPPTAAPTPAPTEEQKPQEEKKEEEKKEGPPTKSPVEKQGDNPPPPAEPPALGENEEQKSTQ